MCVPDAVDAVDAVDAFDTPSVYGIWPQFSGDLGFTKHASSDSSAIVSILFCPITKFIRLIFIISSSCLMGNVASVYDCKLCYTYRIMGPLKIDFSLYFLRKPCIAKCGIATTNGVCAHSTQRTYEFALM